MNDNIKLPLHWQAFKFNDGWGSWEQVIPAAANDPLVVKAYTSEQVRAAVLADRQQRSAAAALFSGCAMDDDPRVKHTCDMGVGCEEYGVCYASANGEPERCNTQQRGTVEDERAEFDTWIASHCDYDDLNESEISLARDAWQARAALDEQKAVPSDDEILRNMCDEMGPLVEHKHHDWWGWPGTYYFALAALRGYRALLSKYAAPVNEQDAKDAQRFEWLKSQMRAMSVDMSGQHSWTLARSLPRAPSVDAACDAGIAAIAQQGKEG